jgi:hypothetical protein
VRLCQEGIEQMQRVHRKELYFKFSEKTESLKILQRLYQEGIEQVKGVHREEISFEFWDKGSVTRKTLTWLLNTL